MEKELELFEQHFGTRLEDITLDLSYTVIALIKEAWLARAALSKPSWKDAPEWANYLAMDDSGYWYWYEYQPEPFVGRFTQGNRYQAIGLVPYTVDWQDTLEQRPEQTV